VTEVPDDFGIVSGMKKPGLTGTWVHKEAPGPSRSSL
jgi:hypothetical protein